MDGWIARIFYISVFVPVKGTFFFVVCTKAAAVENKLKFKHPEMANKKRNPTKSLFKASSVCAKNEKIIKIKQRARE